MRPIWAPFERERRFIMKLNIELIQSALWPLLAGLVLLNFWDTITTLYAAELSSGFVELNPLGAALFRLGFEGFMVAYLLKFIPVVPLFYLVAFRRGSTDEFQYKLLKYMAFLVLASADLILGAIVLGNNLPLLQKAAAG
ncbi:MAG: hypothetical protein JRM99_04480 [Nitrososphaerota archaeon]|nr:hypothetical protein [Nitrososphaerota archaeon]